MQGDTPQFLGNGCRREDEIDGPPFNGAARHARELRGLLILRKSDATFSFNGLNTQRSITASAGEHDGNGAILLIFGQRTEERIDRHRWTFEFFSR